MEKNDTCCFGIISNDWTALKNLIETTRSLVKTHYRGAIFHTENNKIHFKYKTLPIIIQLPLKNGELQDPVEVEGPGEGGILCTMSLNNGPWFSAAVVPQSFDRQFYIDYLFAPYSEKFDCHLYVLLSFPKTGGSEEFLKEFTHLVNNFEDYI